MPSGTRLVGPLTDRVASLLRQRIADLDAQASTVARDAGIPKATFSRLLHGQRPIYLEQLDAICAALGLDLGWLLDEADRQSKGRGRLISVASADSKAEPPPMPSSATGNEPKWRGPQIGTPAQALRSTGTPDGRKPPRT